MKIVSPPIEVNEKYPLGSLSFISAKPPARITAIGSSSTSTPTLFTTNCTMSVRVMDHIPPSAE